MTADDRTDVLRRLDVSRETAEKLTWFVAELGRWQSAKNLVSSATLQHVWTRHVLDSAQLATVAPQAGTWIDLGSGGGFPGLVVAIIRAEQSPGPMHLVESNGRKCAFLRHAAHHLRLPVTVHSRRIEAFVPAWTAPAAVVSARALAPLKTLIDLTHPLLRKGATGIFPKGQDIEIEMAEAARSWQFQADLHPSLSDPTGRLVLVRMAAAEG